MDEVIRRSRRCTCHIATGGDPFEMGSSRPLDFGHWAAHKLEQLTNHRSARRSGRDRHRARHHLFLSLRIPPEDDWRRVIGLLSGAGTAVYAPENSATGPAISRPSCAASRSSASTSAAG